jgi:type I restriction-modification system DNA methylase subunit
MKRSEAIVKFNSLINSIAYSKSIRDVFIDLIDATLYNLIILDDCNLKREPFKNYSETDQKKLVDLMVLLGEIMENNGEGLYDALGDLFMEHLSFGKNGQFFTPPEIADMISKILFSENKILDGQSVNDPACGSGRMFLAAAKINRNFRFYGSDIDLVCVKMSVLNLALNNLIGEIVWGNPITMDHYASFQIGKCVITKFPFISIVKEDKSIHFKASVKQVLEQKKNTSPIQLNLFDDL